MSKPKEEKAKEAEKPIAKNEIKKLPLSKIPGKYLKLIGIVKGEN